MATRAGRDGIPCHSGNGYVYRHVIHIDERIREQRIVHSIRSCACALAFCLPNLLILQLLRKRKALWPAILISDPTCLDFGDLKSPVGVFLFGTKSLFLCIGNVANWWFKWWAGGGDDHEMDGAIDTQILNESLFIEIMRETLPPVIIQIYNNYSSVSIQRMSCVSCGCRAYFICLMSCDVRLTHPSHTPTHNTGPECS
jgi:hypothetical protein